MWDKIYVTILDLKVENQCVGATNVSYDQVDPWRAVFRQEGAGKVSLDFYQSALIVTFCLTQQLFVLFEPYLSEMNNTFANENTSTVISIQFIIKLFQKLHVELIKKRKQL